ncbi:MAG: hypothetical protein V3575_02245 [Candidatus Absconditabacteria bacterium]
MSFKSNILKNYVDSDNIHVVIGHDSWKYFGLLLKNSFYVFALFALYVLLTRFLNPNLLMSLLFSLFGLFVYGKFIIDFMDIYLDAIILTDTGVVLFKWDGLFANKSELLHRESLVAVQDTQMGILDIVLNKGNLIMKRSGGEYSFDNVSHPTKRASMILDMQKKMLNERGESEEEQPDLDKFDVLVETLGEVILDYVKKDKGNYSG